MKQTHTRKVKKEGFTPIEQLVDLIAMGQVDHPEFSCGFYILQRKRSYRCVFGFKSAGIHASQSAEAFGQDYEGLVALCRDLPAGGRLQLRLSCAVESLSRLEHLQSLRSQAGPGPIDWLVAGEQERTGELALQGKRKLHHLWLFPSWAEHTAQAGSRDWIDRAALAAQDWWLTYLGNAEEDLHTQMHYLVSTAHHHCRQWWRLLQLTAKLPVTPMQSDELMAWAWRQFNPMGGARPGSSNTKSSEPRCPEVPRLYRLSGKELHTEVKSDLAFSSILFDTLPELRAERVSIPLPNGNANHCAVMVWDEKPAGFTSPAQQVRYLWTLLARAEVYDTEIVVELSTANERLSRENALRLQRQAASGLQQSQRQGKLIDVPQQLKLEEAAELEKSFIEGCRPLYLAVCILVWHQDPLRLADSCRFITSFFNRPARVVREVSYAWKVFFQCLPFAWDGLLVSPFDRRLELLDEEAPGFLPLVRIHSPDQVGVEFLSEEGQCPLLLDLYSRHRNLALFGTTRSGKSVVLEVLIRHALARQIPVVVMDFPKPDGTSTFSDYTAFVGGAYFDVGSNTLNLFEIPDLRGMPTQARKERLEEFQEFLVSALMVMVLGRDVADALLTQTVRSLLTLAVKLFMDNATIRMRYDSALKGGLGSADWQHYPSLGDLLPFLDPQVLGVDGKDGGIRTALDYILLRLRYWLGSRVGQRLTRPSTIRSDALLLVFALRNVSNAEDMAVLALANYAAALRRALATPVSLFILDEAPILFECEEIANLVGRLCANGAKAGVRVILSAQDPDTIEKASNSSKIFQNLRTRLIGRVEASAIPSFTRVFGYERESLLRNASAQFFPNSREVFSRWLVDDGGTLTHVRYYPSYRSLAVVANNPDEQREREAFLARYPDNRLKALELFTRHYTDLLRSKPC